MDDSRPPILATDVVCQWIRDPVTGERSELVTSTHPSHQRAANTMLRNASVVVALSGGKDSAYVLMAAERHWGMRPVPVLVDTGYMRPLALANARALCERLGLELTVLVADMGGIYRLGAEVVAAGGHPITNICVPCHDAIMSAIAREATRLGIGRVLTGMTDDLRSDVGPLPSTHVLGSVRIESPLMSDGCGPESRRKALVRAGLLTYTSTSPMRTNCRWCPYIIAAGLKQGRPMPYRRAFGGHRLALIGMRLLRWVPLRWLKPRIN